MMPGPQAPARTRGGRGIVVVVVAVLLLGLFERDAIGMSYGPNCVVGIVGTAASVQAQGWLAGAACDALAGGSGQTYRYTGLLTTPVVCQYEIEGIRYTVHDDGALKLFGSQICGELAKSASRATAQQAVAAQAASAVATSAARTTAPPTTVPRTVVPVFTFAATAGPAFVAAAPPVTLATPTVPLGCLLGITGHDMALAVIGRDPMTLCRQLAAAIVLPNQGQWFVPGVVPGVLPSARSAVCNRDFGDLTTVITDSGSTDYGTSACWQLLLLDPHTLAFPETCGLAVSGHNATIAVVGSGALRQCAYLQATFKLNDVTAWTRVDAVVRSGPYGEQTICRVSAGTVVAEVWDTGSAVYGSEICGALTPNSFAR